MPIIQDAHIRRVQKRFRFNNVSPDIHMTQTDMAALGSRCTNCEHKQYETCFVCSGFHFKLNTLLKAYKHHSSCHNH
jgi:hypothetical protein